MSGERTYADALGDILDAVSKAMQFTQGMTFAQFSDDDKTVFAVIRALEIVGEATKKIPAEVRSRASEIPWREMAGMRDKLMHEYFGVSLPVVWKTVQEDLPSLEPEIRKILDLLET